MDHSYNPYFDATGRPKKGIQFSRTEIQHIAGAVGILTVAFAMVLGRPGGSGLWIPPLINFVAAFIAVASGFVLHELGHKVVAQNYGHWAEFRAQFNGLFLSLALAAFIGILFAAPGAVMIMGRVTQRENGYISIVGPGVNFVIALLTAPVAMFTNNDIVLVIFGTVAFVNAVLCVFNLIPLGPLDGKKVMRWSMPMWIGSVALAGGLLFYIWDTLWGPLKVALSGG